MPLLFFKAFLSVLFNFRAPVKDWRRYSFSSDLPIYSALVPVSKGKKKDNEDEYIKIH